MNEEIRQAQEIALQAMKDLIAVSNGKGMYRRNVEASIADLLVSLGHE